MSTELSTNHYYGSVQLYIIHMHTQWREKTKLFKIISTEGTHQYFAHGSYSQWKYPGITMKLWNSIWQNCMIRRWGWTYNIWNIWLCLWTWECRVLEEKCGNLQNQCKRRTKKTSQSKSETSAPFYSWQMLVELLLHHSSDLFLMSSLYQSPFR